MPNEEQEDIREAFSEALEPVLAALRDIGQNTQRNNNTSSPSVPWAGNTNNPAYQAQLPTGAGMFGAAAQASFIRGSFGARIAGAISPPPSKAAFANSPTAGLAGVQFGGMASSIVEQVKKKFILKPITTAAGAFADTFMENDAGTALNEALMRGAAAVPYAGYEFKSLNAVRDAATKRLVGVSSAIGRGGGEMTTEDREFIYRQFFREEAGAALGALRARQTGAKFASAEALGAISDNETKAVITKLLNPKEQ